MRHDPIEAHREPHATRLVLRRTIQATREAIFDAWTDPDSLARWMCPGDVTSATADLDVRVGGAFRIVMHAPGRDYVHEGVYRVVDRPSRLVFTWVSAGTGHRTTLVTVELLDRQGATELVLTHERLPDAESAARHRGGWDRIVARLDAHLSTAT